MIVYRLSQPAYADDLSGRGAELYGGRWNSKGFRLLYTSSTRALCTVEIAANLQLGMLPPQYKVISIEIPDSSILELPKKDYPKDWNSFPHLESTQRIGNEFIKAAKHLTIKVESALVQDEYNYLINPLHKSFRYVKIKKVEDFSFSSRLMKA